MRRASRSTDGTDPGEGALSAGYLAPSANPSAPASGGAVSKPGPDSSEEWMACISYMHAEWRLWVLWARHLLKL